MLKNTFDALLYFMVKILFKALSFFPVFLTWCIAEFIGMVWYICDKRHRTLCVKNLTHAFLQEMSKNEIKTLARQNFVNTVNILFEMARAYHWKSDQLPDYVRVKGLGNLKKAHQDGKGVLLLTGHVGNWEMSVHLKTLVGINGSGIYRRLDSSALDRYILEKRQMTGCRMYPVKDAVMGVFYELGQGNFTGILCDQNAKRSQGVFVDFFGRMQSPIRTRGILGWL